MDSDSSKYLSRIYTQLCNIPFYPRVLQEESYSCKLQPITRYSTHIHLSALLYDITGGNKTINRFVCV